MFQPFLRFWREVADGLLVEVVVKFQPFLRFWK